MKTLYDEKFIRAQDGIKLYLRDYNIADSSTSPIICLPGLTRNSKDFHKFAINFYKKKRVISIDMRGRGNSDYDKSAKNYWKPEIYMSDIFAITSSLNIHKAIYVGTSLGGLMAMQVALLRPTSVSGIILNDIGPNLPEDGVNSIRKNLIKPLEFYSWEEASQYYKKKYKHHHPKINDKKWMELTKNTFRYKNKRIISDYDKKILIGSVRSSQSNNLWKLYGAIKNIPSIVLRGELSDILLEDTYNKMKLIKEDIIQLTVRNCGHNPMLDEPEVINLTENFFHSLK